MLFPPTDHECLPSGAVGTLFCRTDPSNNPFLTPLVQSRAGGDAMGFTRAPSLVLPHV